MFEVTRQELRKPALEGPRSQRGENYNKLSSTFTSNVHLYICRFMAWVIQAKKVSAWAYSSLTGVGRQMLKLECNRVIRIWQTKIQKLKKLQRRKPRLLCDFPLRRVLTLKPCRIKCRETKCKGTAWRLKSEQRFLAVLETLGDKDESLETIKVQEPK